MNVDEIMVQTPAILMERRREKECWRIRKTYYRPFIAHLKHFFMAEAWPFSMLESLRYIDIDERDFCLLSYLFAIFEVKGDQITVKGIFPQNNFPTWEERITLHLCVKDADCERIVSVRLEMKPDTRNGRR